MNKENFAKNFEDTITKWADFHKGEILRYWDYRWMGKSHEESLNQRNDQTEKIIKSRNNNNGAVDKATIAEIFKWGFPNSNSETKVPFKEMSERDVLTTTGIAFKFLDRNDCQNACKVLMEITWETPHPAGATKILGLSDPQRFCIYDRYVGLAFNDLTKDGRRIIHSPSFEKGSTYRWAGDYQKLIWLLEIIQSHLLNNGGNKRSIAQLEMALFMMGRKKTKNAIDTECEECNKTVGDPHECNICGRFVCDSCWGSKHEYV